MSIFILMDYEISRNNRTLLFLRDCVIFPPIVYSFYFKNIHKIFYKKKKAAALMEKKKPTQKTF